MQDLTESARSEASSWRGSSGSTRCDRGRLRQWAGTVLPLAIALVALVSLNPYFIWSQQKVWYAVASGLVIVCLLVSRSSLAPERSRLVLAGMFSLFLVYLSLLPKVQGPPTRWYLLIPFALAVLTVNREVLLQAFNRFYLLFALSLIPGMLVWMWLAAGLPLELTHFTLPTDLTNNRVINFLGVPGAIFLPVESVVLPGGGVLFRLCAVYDEPGTVGTIAALCLAATRFRLMDVRGLASLVAGIMSFSLAFAVLVVVGLVATAILEKRLKVAAAVLAGIAAGVLALSALNFERAPGGSPTIRVAPSPSHGGDTVKASPEHLGLGRSAGLRWFRFRDNRATSEMRDLLQSYAASSPGTVLFGIASDASVVYGRASAVWYSVLTDYGVVGLTSLLLLYWVPVLLLWRAGRLDAALVMFCALYFMSFYQRPVIWLPAQMLIYFAGIYWTTLPRHFAPDEARS